MKGMGRLLLPFSVSLSVNDDERPAVVLFLVRADDIRLNFIIVHKADTGTEAAMLKYHLAASVRDIAARLSAGFPELCRCRVLTDHRLSSRSFWGLGIRLSCEGSCSIGANFAPG